MLVHAEACRRYAFSVVSSLVDVVWVEYDDDPPTVAQVEKTIAALSKGKAPGSDAIPAEIYKTGGTRLAIKINELFDTLWSAEGVPQEFKDACIVHHYKKKT